MKDRQIPTSGTQPSVPIVSPILHWMAMPAIVFLRSGFGYSFLSPKFVFLPFCWASLLFLVYAWMAGGAWPRNWAIATFAAAASATYLLHLLAAVTREVKKTGKHDYYSGTSHLLRIPGLEQNRTNSSLGTVLHLWVEPGIVFVAATALRAFLGEQRLSTWLIFVAAALWFKAFINYWYTIRAEKKHGDIIEDAEEKMPGAGGQTDAPLPNAGGRKPRAKRAPQTSGGDEDLKALEQKHAEVLRLMPPTPPYNLQQAEQNYRELIKAFHPDIKPTPENEARALALNEAIAFFRNQT